jgi:sigma-E factor negative regulatory protein RseA
MTEMLRQSLSAAIDDEADAFELRRVLDELNRDPELQAAWDRFHLIGSALRGERRTVRSDMRDRIWIALDGDPGALEVAEAPATLDRLDAVEVEQPAPRGSRRRYAGLAVAASVAFAVAIGSSFFGTGTDGEALPELAAADVGASAVAAPAVAPAEFRRATQATDVPAPDLQRAHAYMLHHTQQQAMNQSSVMSLVKLATYEAP